MKASAARQAAHRETTPPVESADRGDEAIPVDGIRYVSYVDAQAQPDSGSVLLLARCVNRSVYRATISRATAVLIRDRLSKAIDAA